MAKKITPIVLILALLVFPLFVSCTAKTSGLPTTRINLSATNTAGTTPAAQNASSTNDATPVVLADQGKLLLNGQIFDFKRIDK
jgi:hypothetical protein